MPDERQLVLLEEGKHCKVACLRMGQDCDFEFFIDNLSEITVEKIVEKVRSLSEGENKKSIKHEFDGIFTIKHEKIRIPYFWHNSIRSLIVITHCFIKKTPKWSKDQKERSLKRKKIGNNIKVLTVFE